MSGDTKRVSHKTAFTVGLIHLFTIYLKVQFQFEANVRFNYFFDLQLTQFNPKTLI